MCFRHFSIFFGPDVNHIFSFTHLRLWKFKWIIVSLVIRVWRINTQNLDKGWCIGNIWLQCNFFSRIPQIYLSFLISNNFIKAIKKHSTAIATKAKKYFDVSQFDAWSIDRSCKTLLPFNGHIFVRLLKQNCRLRNSLMVNTLEA